MKKYYIVEFGEVVNTAEFLGNFEDIDNAKDAAFEKMNAGDLLVGFDMDFDAEYTDKYGYDTVHFENAEKSERLYMNQTDDSIENVPEGLWYWLTEDGEVYDDNFYRGNGEVWEN